jgi:hypothetical protein
MMDPTTVSDDRFRETGRWGYTGDLVEDAVPADLDDGPGVGRWLLWIALLAIVVIALIALFGAQA